MTCIAALALTISVSAFAAHQSTTFKVRIEDVWTGETLKLMAGGTAPAPNSPGAWAVTSGGVRPFFTSGKKDLGYGMEAQAEDGNPAPLVEHFKNRKGVVTSGLFNTPVGDTEPGPALPGKAYEFSFTASPGQRLSIVTMFGQSNDLFYGFDDRGIALFEGGKPLSGDISSRFLLWDAGTEVNQEPGSGADQAPQKAPNTGAKASRSGTGRGGSCSSASITPRSRLTIPTPASRSTATGSDSRSQAEPRTGEPSRNT